MPAKPAVRSAEFRLDEVGGTRRTSGGREFRGAAAGTWTTAVS